MSRYLSSVSSIAKLGNLKLVSLLNTTLSSRNFCINAWIIIGAVSIPSICSDFQCASINRAACGGLCPIIFISRNSRCSEIAWMWVLSRFGRQSSVNLRRCWNDINLLYMNWSE